MNQDILVEFASPDKSREPAFRRDFFALAEKIKSNEHPALLKLYAFGEEEGRLCRMWENPPLFSAASIPPENTVERRRQLAQAVEGFQLLQEMGVSLENHSPVFLSSHPREKRMFIARYPFIPEGTPRGSSHVPNFMYYACPPNSKILGERCFLIQLGVFVGLSLVNEFPFASPPIFCKRDGVPVVRKELPLEPPLREVVDRLTQLDPNANYPDVTAGLEELKKALGEESCWNVREG